MTRPAAIDAISYGVKDAGRAIGVSEATMWRLIRAGSVKTFKLGTRTLIDAEDLRAFVSQVKAA